MQFARLIGHAQRRLDQVIVENKDFAEVIRHYDNAGAFFYCDPPYYGTKDMYEITNSRAVCSEKKNNFYNNTLNKKY